MSKKIGVLSSIGIITVGAYLFCSIFLPIPVDQKNKTRQKIPEESIDGQWKPYRAANEKCILFFPSVPQHIHETIVDIETKESIAYDLYSAQDPNESFYFVTMIQYPLSFDISDANALLDRVLAEMAPRTNIEYNSKKRGEFLSFPSIDFEFDTGSGYLYTKALLIDRTVYVFSLLNRNREKGRANFIYFTENFSLL